MKRIKQVNNDGFTLIEMLVVLLVIAVLILLFVPNLAKQQSKITARGDEAFTQVIKTQAELYRMNEGDPVTYEKLLAEHYLTNQQVDKAKELGIDLAQLDD